MVCRFISEQVYQVWRFCLSTQLSLGIAVEHITVCVNTCKWMLNVLWDDVEAGALRTTETLLWTKWHRLRTCSRSIITHFSWKSNVDFTWQRDRTNNKPKQHTVCVNCTLMTKSVMVNKILLVFYLIWYSSLLTWFLFLFLGKHSVFIYLFV